MTVSYYRINGHGRQKLNADSDEEAIRRVKEANDKTNNLVGRTPGYYEHNLITRLVKETKENIWEA